MRLRTSAGIEPAVMTRRASIDDLETLVTLRIAMQRDLGEIAPGEEDAVSEAVRRYLREKLGTEELVALLAELGGEVVGTGWLVLHRRPPSSKNLAGIEGYILNMYTAPGWRRKGIARAIVEDLMSAARTAGARFVALRASDEGRGVYEKAGFAENSRYLQRNV